MEKATKTPKSIKAQITRASLVVAAAAILRAQGPGDVTYRRVAEWAGASSSSVGYYFESIGDLLYEAAQHNIALWAQRAEKAANEAEGMTQEQCRENCVALLLRACLPEGLSVPAAHYAQLIDAAESLVVTQAYQRGRRRLDVALKGILDQAGISMSPQLVTAIVDGAAVKAISEGYDVFEIAETLLGEAVTAYGRLADGVDAARQSSKAE
ncbi:MAG: TetR/AcrR family transcriptional regulator [Raoultibacter sp.]